jgi:hypothetical protein
MGDAWSLGGTGTETKRGGDGVDTKELTQRLSRHYIKPSDPLPGGVFLTEVMSPAERPSFENAGFTSRRVDALYMGFTAARGRYLEGHEIKISRSDWLHELNQPHKANWWFERTHRWWVVAANDAIVELGELPEGWGLMIPTTKTRTKLQVVVKAALRDPIIDFGLLHEITKKMDTLRRDATRAHELSIHKQVYDGLAVALRGRLERDATHAERELANLKTAVATFEASSGVKLSTYGAENIGEAVAMVLAQNTTTRNYRRDLTNIQRRVHDLSAQVDKDVAELAQQSAVSPRRGRQREMS